MTTRKINLESFNHPDDRVMAWFRANGINPSDVPVAQDITVDGDKLTFLAFVLDDGHKIMDSTTSDPSWLKEIRTVTLTSAPENFGL